MMAKDLRILSYNILNPELAVKWEQPEGTLYKDGVWHSNWDERRHQLVANIAAAKADIVLLQELGPGFIPELPPHLALSKLCLHSPTKQGIYYGNAIAADVTRFRLDAEPLFSNEARDRASCFGSLWDRENKCAYFVISAHLAGYGPNHANSQELQEKASEGDDQLRRLLWWHDEHIGPQLFVIGGDFNMDPLQHRNRADLMAQYNYFAAPGRVASEPATGREIDFIFAQGVPVTALSEPAIDWPYPKASDHLPRVLDIRFTP
jgi:endonuclease/exonuclease/phosphatase family metal-dependent hydrolase